MSSGPLELRAPSQAFPFVFLIAVGIVLLNGVGFLIFPFQNQPRWSLDPVLFSTVGSTGVDAAVWSFRRQFQVSRLIERMDPELPHIGVDPASRSDVLRTILDRMAEVKYVLVPFQKGVILPLSAGGKEGPRGKGFFGPDAPIGPLSAGEGTPRAFVVAGELI